MDWTTLASAFVGGISGGVIGGLVTVAQLRTDRRAALRARQWLDAEVIADVQQLLTDILPERRGMNLSSDKEVERAKSAALDQRSRQVDRDLLKLAAGHPSTLVAKWAHDLSSAIVRAVYASEWHVRDTVAGGFNEKTLSTAQRAHAEATTAAKELESAVKKAGSR